MKHDCDFLKQYSFIKKGRSGLYDLFQYICCKSRFLYKKNLVFYGENKDQTEIMWPEIIITTEYTHNPYEWQ